MSAFFTLLYQWSSSTVNYRLFQKRYRLFGTRMLFLKGQALVRNKAKRTHNKFRRRPVGGSPITASAVLQGPLGTLASKTGTDMLSLSGATGLGLVKGGFLNKCSFQLYTVFPTLYSALCSMRSYHSLCFVCKPIIGSVSRSTLFC